MATARNDDHGGNLLGRMQVFVDSWVGQAKRYGLQSELILVEWNPPAQRPRLASVLRWPADPDPCRIRILEVPPELHAQYRHAAALPLYQMIAKNAGIRRALGEFVLVTNIDVVFSDEVVRFLASRQLDKDRMYRIDRHDTMSDVPVDGALDEQLEYCRTHLLRLCAREGVLPLTEDGLRRTEASDITGAGSGINFGPGWNPVERYGTGPVFRWIDNDAEVIAQVPEGGAFLSLEVEPGPGVPQLPQILRATDESGSVVAEWNISKRETLELLVAPEADGPRRFRFSLPGAGVPVLHDPRMLNLRVFRCDWLPDARMSSAPLPLSEILLANRPVLTRLLGNWYRHRGSAWPCAGPLDLLRSAARLLGQARLDVIDSSIEHRLAGGFYDVEECGGERFRWVGKEARFIYRTEGEPESLEFLVEPGPALGFKPFDLVARWGESEKVERIPVSGLTLVRLEVPAGRGWWVQLRLRAEGGGKPAGSDPRYLTFRIFAIGRGAATGSSARDPKAGGWYSRTLASNPPDLDWSGRSEEDLRMIAAMGKPEFLHLNACGDFTLMAREQWHDLRGYAELDQFSMHLDSLLCYAAHHAGVRELVLPEPMRIYHIEHGAGSGWTPEGQDAMYARIARQGIPTVSYEDLVHSIAQMRILHAPVIFNMENWGLAGVELNETVPAGAGRMAEARG